MRNEFIFEISPFAMESRNDIDGSRQNTRRIQQALNRELGLQLPSDGAMGFRTRRALRDFQLQKGLPVDGTANPETLRALLAKAPRAARPASEFEFEFEEELTAPVNKFEDCTNAQKNAIIAVLRNAHLALNNAAAVLGSVYGGSTPMSARTRLLLNRHFHTTDRSNILKIFRTIFRISQAIQKGLSFECETKCREGDQGYAWTTQWFGGFGDIHICFDDRLNHWNFSKLKTVTEQVALIIHEAAHRYVGIDDHVYREDTVNYSKLSAGKAMNNADSYAWFCAQLYYGT
jgi:hypothetical protein